MKKVQDLEKEERDKISTELELHSGLLGQDYWESHNPSLSFDGLERKLGICGKCINLDYCRTEFGKTFAKCSNLEIILKGGDKMIECTRFSPRGQMSLSDMKENAVLIDPPKRKAGMI